MTRQVVTVHPFDPWGSKIGGIENFIRLFLQHSPDNVEHFLIGVSEDLAMRPLRKWTLHHYKTTPVHFYPVMSIDKPNRRSWVPLFLKFPLLVKRERFKFDNALFLFHRVEPLAFDRQRSEHNALFLHSHPLEWIGARSEVKWKYLPWAYRWVEKRAFHKARQIFCVNQTTVDYVKEHDSEKSCEFLPTTFDETLFSPPTREEKTHLRQEWAEQYTIPLDSKWILFVGRLEHQKNPKLALETVASVKNEFTIQLLIAGEGSLKAEILNAAHKLNIRENVHLLGSLNSIQMARLYKAGDVLLISSQFEGMPLSVLEALGCGLPVVSTPVGEIPHLIQQNQNGAISPDHSPTSLVNSLNGSLKHFDETNAEDCAESVIPFRSKIAMERLHRKLSCIGNR